MIKQLHNLQWRRCNGNLNDANLLYMDLRDGRRRWFTPRTTALAMQQPLQALDG